jgi:hypothetical protein
MRYITWYTYSETIPSELIPSEIASETTQQYIPNLVPATYNEVHAYFQEELKKPEANRERCACAKLPENQVQFKAEGLRIRIALTRGVYAIVIIHLLYLPQVIFRDWGDSPD